VFNTLFQSYNEFHAGEIQTNRFQPEKFNEILDQLTENVELTKLGESIEGRPIRMLKLGSGKTKVLMWSQMHGNESTASRAILDLLKFNEAPGTIAKDWQKVIQHLTVYIIPILNPDGAAAFKRRNAAEVDLNRDARAFECPESKILQSAMDSIKPDFSFNLHDQRRFYNISNTAKPSTISFLAPAFDSTESVNKSRLAAMQLIAAMQANLESVIPGQVGLYNDSYAPRAFGDYSQGTGASTVLIEAGWEQYDMEKEHVRKLNFCVIASALQSIADKSYTQFSEEDYRQIPMNDERLFDVIIRGTRMVINGKQVQVDIGLEREEISIPGTEIYYSIGRVKDIGDLADWYGFDDITANELLVTKGAVSEMSLVAWQELDEAEQADHIKAGNLYIVASNVEAGGNSSELINMISDNKVPEVLEFEKPANFLLINRQGDIKYIVINGFLWPIDEAPPEELNGLIIS
jgi:hypothetical protein